MNCSDCGTEARNGARYCTQCGAALFLSCPKCGAAIVPEDRFCGGCGARVNHVAAATLPPGTAIQARPGGAKPVAIEGGAAAKEMDSERKNVTVLFADISGFTAMSETLDPEEVTTIMNGCLTLMADTVVRYEGYVDKFIGDCVMALFGAPVTHENDPELALRAALDMKRALEDYNKRLPVKLDKPLTLHIGVNSGVVIAGGVGSDNKMDYTVMGDTVNLASRLESIAGTGQIFVSSYTYNLTRNLFDFHPHEPIKVKGKKDPVAVYEVSKAKTKSQTKKAGARLVPLVGRSQEMETLRACAAGLSDGRAQAVFVTSDPGIGKSHVLAELKASFREGELQIIEGTCRSFSQSTSYYVFADIFRSLLDIDSEDLPESMAAKISGNLPLLLRLDAEALDDAAREAIVFIGAMLGVRLADEFDVPIDEMDGQQLQMSTFRAVAWFFERLAEAKPLVLALDNLHHADSTSIELIAHLFEALRKREVMLVLLMRPTKEHGSSKLPLIAKKAIGEGFSEIALERFLPAECDEFVCRLMNTEAIPDEVLRLVRERSDGNPLYIEEIIRSLVEDGVVETADDGAVRVAKDLGEIAIPSSIQGLIIARIDKLQSALKDILQTAAVIGTVFKQALIERLVEGGGIDDKLGRLADMGLIFESSSFPEIEYSFRNILIQEAVYSTLLHKKRKELHAAVAHAIEGLYGSRLDDHFELLAEHYRQADDLPQAYQFMIKSARKAKEAYANQEAARYFRQAIEIGARLDAPPTPLEEAYIELSDTCELLGELDDAIACWREASERVDDELRKADAIRNIGRIEEKRGSKETALDIYRQAGKLLEAHPNTVEAGLLLMNQSWVLNQMGESDAAVEEANRALEIFEAHEAQEQVAQVCNNLAVVLEHKGELDKALDYNRRSLELSATLANKRRTANVNLSMGFLERKRGNPEAALDYFDKAHEIMDRIGNRFGAGTALMSKGECYIDLDQLDPAESALLSALRIHRELDLKAKILTNELALCRVYLLTGDDGAAREHLAPARSIAAERNRVRDLAEATWLEARLLILEGKKPDGKFEEAIKLFTDADRAREAAAVRAELEHYAEPTAVA